MTEDRNAFLKRLLDEGDAGAKGDAGAEGGADRATAAAGRGARSVMTAAAQPDRASYVVTDAWDDERQPQGSMAQVRAAGGRLRARGGHLRDRLGLGARGDGAASAGTKRATRLLLFALAVVGALAGLGVAWIHTTTDPLADVHAYYDAATRLNHGQSLYPATADTNAADFYRYPPLLAIVLRPLAAALPYAAFAALWELLVVASFVGLLWYLGVRSPRTWIAVGILGVPIGWALSIGQAQVPLTLLVAIGQPWSVALAANLKLFPALILVWWLGRRDYQASVAFLLWAALLAGAQLLLEPGGTNAFIHSVGLDEVGDVRNISPYALSPQLWAVLLLVGIVVTWGVSRSRAGWSAAVALATLAAPRLLVYALMTLLASVREPQVAPLDVPEPRGARIYTANS